MGSPRTMATQKPLVGNDFPTYGLRRLALVMHRSGVQIPEAAPRKHVANRRVLRDSTETADPLEAELPQIDLGRDPVLQPLGPFRPPPGKSFACLVGSLTCLATSRVRPAASPLRLGQESRRDWTRPEERAALRDWGRGRCSCPVDSCPAVPSCHPGMRRNGRACRTGKLPSGRHRHQVLGGPHPCQLRRSRPAAGVREWTS